MAGVGKGMRRERMATKIDPCAVKCVKTYVTEHGFGALGSRVEVP